MRSLHLVLEAGETCGGGTRSAELTLPGFLNDVCSAVHPMALASGFFRNLPLARFGLEWITPPTAAAHPLDSGEAVLLTNDVDGDGAASRSRSRSLFPLPLGPSLETGRKSKPTSSAR